MSLAPFAGTNSEKPASEDKSPEFTSSPNGREWSETKDGSTDDAEETSASPQARLAANTTATNEPAISNSTDLGPDPEQPSSLSPLSHGAPAPTSAQFPADRRPISSATPEIKPRSVYAGRRSQSDIPQEDGCGCWTRCKRRLQEHERQKSHGIVPEPEKLSGPKFLTPWTPRPRYERTSGSMAYPWGLKQPVGLQV